MHELTRPQCADACGQLLICVSVELGSRGVDRDELQPERLDPTHEAVELGLILQFDSRPHQAARRPLGNIPPDTPEPTAWSLENAVLYTLMWVGIVIAVFAPLAIHRYKRMRATR